MATARRERPADLASRRAALQRDPVWQEALRQAGEALAAGPLPWALEPYQTPAGPGRTVEVGRGLRQGLWQSFGIEDPRRDKRIDFVGGIRDTAELEKRVKSGKAAVAFALHPVSIEQLIRVADAGQVMPPKSTWFEPKLRSGLFVRPFGD